MGYLNYANASTPIVMDDRLLAHVRTVTVTKLRRGEAFALTVPTCEEATETLWMHASIPLRFDLDGEVGVDRDLLVAMMHAANSSGGLDLSDHELAARASVHKVAA